MIDITRKVVASAIESAFSPVPVYPSHVVFDKEGVITWGWYNIIMGEPYRISLDPGGGVVIGGYVIVDVFSDARKRTESPSVIASRVYQSLSNTRFNDATSGVTNVEFGVPGFEMAGSDAEDRNLERVVIRVPFKVYHTS